MRHEELEELIPAYALGALDGEDLRAAEAHLQAGCPRCERLLQELSGVAAHLTESLPDVPLPPRLKERVLERIEQEGRVEAPVPPSRRRPWLLPWGLAIGATAAASLLFWNGLTLRQALERERAGKVEEQQTLAQDIRRLQDQLARREVDVTRLQAKLEEEQTRLKEQEQESAVTVKNLQDWLQREKALLASLQGRLAGQEAIIRVIEDPQSRVVTLGGLKPAPEASGKVIWHPVQQTALFYAHRLPALPSDKIYQLWTITERPVSGGIFAVDHLGNASVRMTAIPRQVKTFAVTIEPAGGLPQPSGAIYLAGSL